MNNEELDRRTKEIEQKDIGTGGEALANQQEAQAQLQSIQDEQRANLMAEKAESQQQDQTTALMAQAAQIGASGGHGINIQPHPAVQKFQSHQVQVSPSHITINNTTTNNTKVEGGGSGDNPSKFKTWMSTAMNQQKEASAKRDREYEKRESFLSRAADKMLKRVVSAGKSVAETLDPQRLGTTVGNQFKILLMVFGLRFLAKYWGRILPWIVRIGNFISTTADYFGLTERGRKQHSKLGSGFYNDLVRFLGGQPGVKGKSSLYEVGRLWVKQLTDYLSLKFEHMMELRREAIKSIKFPDLDLTNIPKTLGSVAQYLGNILTALVDPKSAMHNTIRANINTIGLEQSLKNSKSWKNDTFSRDTDYGDASFLERKDGQRNYSLEKSYLDPMGNLKRTEAAQVSQSMDILGSLVTAKKTGQIDTARLAAGLQRLQDSAKGGVVTVDPEFLKLYDSGTLNNLLKSGDIQRKQYKFVRVKRTDAEKWDEEHAGGIYGAVITSAKQDIGEKIAGRSGRALGAADLGSGAMLDSFVLGNWAATTDAAITGGVNGLLFANNYTLKLVPAEDNSLGGAVMNNGRPWFTNLYTLDKKALNLLAQKTFGAKKGIDVSDENFLRGIERVLTQKAGGTYNAQNRWKKMSKYYGMSDQKQKTFDIDKEFKDIRDFDNEAAAFKSEENAMWADSVMGRTADNVKGTVAGAINYTRDLANTGYEFIKNGGLQRTVNRIFGDGTWKGANYFGRPLRPIDNPSMVLNVRRTSDVAISNTSKRICDDAGNLLPPSQYRSKSPRESIHRCALYVRVALAAGFGIDELKGHPKYACNYVDHMYLWGFKPLSWDSYAPREGDVLVSAPNPVNTVGHICIKTPNGWCSDFQQRDMWGGSAMRNTQRGVVFRNIHTTSNSIQDAQGDSVDTSGAAPIENYAESALYDSEGNIVGYKTGDGQMVDKTGNLLTSAQQATVVSTAQISGGENVGSGWASDEGNAAKFLVGKSAYEVAGPIMNKLMNELGLSRAQAAGVVGNLYAESGLGTSGYNIGTKKWDVNDWSGGVAMWHGKRLRDLISFARSQGRSWGDVNVQLEFLKNELESMGVADKLRNASSAEEASLIMAQNFERFAGYKNANGAENRKRMAYAKMFLNNSDVTQSYNDTIGSEADQASNEVISALKQSAARLQKGIEGLKVACVGDSWMAGLLSISGGGVTAKDRTGYKATNANNVLFSALKKRGVGECVGFARGGARLQDMVSYVAQVLNENPDVIIVHAGLNNCMSTPEKLATYFNKVQTAAGKVPIFFCDFNYVVCFEKGHKNFHLYASSPLMNKPNQGAGIINNLNIVLGQSGVNHLDIIDDQFRCKESPDGLHPIGHYPALAEKIAAALAGSAKNYDYTAGLEESNETVMAYSSSNTPYWNDETLGGIISFPEFQKLSYEEQKEMAIKAGEASKLWQNDKTLQAELKKSGSSYKQFEKFFMSMSDKDQKDYIARHEASTFWNSIDPKYRNFRFLEGLGGDAQTRFENMYIGMNENDRRDFINDLGKAVEYKKFKDSKGYTDIGDKENQFFKRDINAFRNHWWSESYYQEMGANNSNNISSTNRFELNLDDDDKLRVLNALRIGDIDSAVKLIKDNNNNYGYSYVKQSETGLNRAIQEVINKVINQKKYNEITNAVIKGANKIDQKYSGRNLTRQERGQKYSDEIELEKQLYIRKHLADDFETTSNKNSDIQNARILEMNKNLRDLNEKYAKLTYYYDPTNSKQRNKRSGLYGMTDRFAEKYYTMFETGQLDQDSIYTAGALKKRMERDAAEIRKQAANLEIERQKIIKTAKYGADEANKWAAIAEKTSDKNKRNATLAEELRGNFGISLDNMGFDINGHSAEQVQNAIKQAYINLQKRGALDTETLYKALGFDQILDANGKALFNVKDVKNGNAWNSWIKAQKDNLPVSQTYGQNVVYINGKKATSSEQIGNAIAHDQANGALMNYDQYNAGLDSLNRLRIKGLVDDKGNLTPMGKALSAKNKWIGTDSLTTQDQEDFKNINSTQYKKLTDVLDALGTQLKTEEENRLKAAGETGYSVSKGKYKSFDINSDFSNTAYAGSARAQDEIREAGGRVIEQRVSLSDGTSITKLYDSKGRYLTTVIPDDVREAREKSFNQVYKQLGFSTDRAMQRQKELEAATSSYRHNMSVLQAQGISAQEAQVAAQSACYDQISNIFRMAQGMDGGIVVLPNGADRNPKQDSVPDQTKTNRDKNWGGVPRRLPKDDITTTWRNSSIIDKTGKFGQS